MPAFIVLLRGAVAAGWQRNNTRVGIDQSGCGVVSRVGQGVRVVRFITGEEKRNTTTSAPMPRKGPSGSWYWVAMAQRRERTLPRPRRLERSARRRFQPMAYRARRML